MKTGAMIGLSLAVLAALQGASAAPREEAGVAVPAAEIVAARRAAMMMSGATFGALRAQANAENLKRAGFPARGLNAWAKAIPGMFPPGTEIPPTEALPVVWTDRAGFETAAQTLAIATSAVSQAVAANDKTAYAAALDQVGKACSGCHDKYRKAEDKH